MFDFIRRWFPKKKAIKNFSFTTDPVTIGSDNKKEFSPEVKEIVGRLKQNESITNEDLNKVTAFYFNQPTIEPGVYNINKSIVEAMCFEITGVNTVQNEHGDIVNIYLNMKELTFNNEVVMTVSVKDFHEMFTRLNFQP